MAFQILTMNFDNQSLCLSESVFNNENIFTVVTGKNGSGKSRLLNEIVMYYLMIHGESAVKTQVIDIGTPSTIAAISTSKTNKFPFLYKKNHPISYTYIGTKSNDFFAKATDFNKIIEKFIIKNNNQSSILSDTFKYLGFKSCLDIDLIATNVVEFNYSSNNSSVESSLAYSTEKIRELMQENNVKLNRKEELALLKFVITKNLNKKIYLSLNFEDKSENTIELLSILIRLELYKIKTINLHQKSSQINIKISFDDLSSGQQSLLTIMLGIASCIKDKALICIDEPEISLHPEWQSEVVSKIQEGFSNFKGCHFIIATHSPQIVSGLINKNSFIFSMEDKKLHKMEEYAKRSADFQLANIFQSPGYNNEYLIRISLVILSKLSKQENLTENDVHNLENLRAIHSKISIDDPVYYLIKQVLAMGD